MKFLPIVAASSSLFSLSSAIIHGIAVPDTIKPGDGFNAIIETSNYIQSVADVAIAFGVSPSPGWQGALGQPIGSYYLGPEQSNVLYNITKWVTLPASVGKGPSLITASLFSLFGAASAPTLSNYNVSITVGDFTSSNYVSSKP